MRRWPGRVGVALSLCGGLMLSNAAVAGRFDKVAGDWQGQAEFRASLGGADDAAAYGIYDLVIRIEPGGKVFSGRVANGCRFLGIVTPFVSSFQIQGQMSDCREPSLNGRYRGHVARLNEESITFRLQMSVVRGAPLPSLEGAALSGVKMTTGKSRNATVESTMTVR